MKTWTVLDKSTWGPGPWNQEPDKTQWVDEATGLDCLAVRHEGSGHWCGYVGVPPTHPAFGKGYDDVRGTEEDYVSVHGGITFAGRCQPGDPDNPGKGICHVPEPGRPEVWWFGFDCNHYQDFAPKREAEFRAPGGIYERIGISTSYMEGSEYRTLDFVREECSQLAGQLASLK